MIAQRTTNDLIRKRERRDGDMNQDVIHQEVPLFSEGEREENGRESVKKTVGRE